MKVQVGNPFIEPYIIRHSLYRIINIVDVVNQHGNYISRPYHLCVRNIHKHWLQFIRDNTLCIQINIDTSGYFPTNLITIELFSLLLIMPFTPLSSIYFSFLIHSLTHSLTYPSSITNIRQFVSMACH